MPRAYVGHVPYLDARSASWIAYLSRAFGVSFDPRT